MAGATGSSADNKKSSWASYPVSSEKHSFVKQWEAMQRRKHLDENATRLFTDSDIEVRIVQVLSQETGSDDLLASHTIRNVHDLATGVLTDASRSLQTIIVLKQAYSWGHLRINQEVLQRILSFYDAFSPLLDTFQLFGLRIRDSVVADDRCRMLITTKSDSDRSRIYELCYSCQYMAQNGRNWGDPWSLRRSGVYQRFDSDTGTSLWILINPSEEAERMVTDLVQQRDLSPSPGSNSHLPGATLRGINPMHLHVLFISLIVSRWPDYIEDIYSSLLIIDEKAQNCLVDRKARYDYSIHFEDVQKLHGLRQKLLATIHALQSSAETIESCLTYCQNLGSSDPAASGPEIQQSLQAYSAQVQLYTRSAHTVLTYLESTAGMLEKTISIRNERLLKATVNSTNQALEAMRTIAHQNHRELSLLAQVTVRTEKESLLIKALTTIATIYLPASLIAGVFNSNLIQVRDESDKQPDKTYFATAPQFWIFVVMTFAFTVITVIVAR